MFGLITSGNRSYLLAAFALSVEWIGWKQHVIYRKSASASKTLFYSFSLENLLWFQDWQLFSFTHFWNIFHCSRYAHLNIFVKNLGTKILSYISSLLQSSLEISAFKNDDCFAVCTFLYQGRSIRESPKVAGTYIDTYLTARKSTETSACKIKRGCRKNLHYKYVV